MRAQARSTALRTNNKDVPALNNNDDITRGAYQILYSIDPSLNLVEVSFIEDVMGEFSFAVTDTPKEIRKERAELLEVSLSSRGEHTCNGESAEKIHADLMFAYEIHQFVGGSFSRVGYRKLRQEIKAMTGRVMSTDNSVAAHFSGGWEVICSYLGVEGSKLGRPASKREDPLDLMELQGAALDLEAVLA